MQIIANKKECSFVCFSEGTRYGFRHVCDVFKNGYFFKRYKICYYNRTWERWTFESVLNKAAAAVGVERFEESPV